MELSTEAVSRADCVLIITDHRAIDYEWLAELAPLLIDTRNATRELVD